MSNVCVCVCVCVLVYLSQINNRNGKINGCVDRKIYTNTHVCVCMCMHAHYVLCMIYIMCVRVCLPACVGQGESTLNTEKVGACYTVVRARVAMQSNQRVFQEGLN